jgi:hypothetical protein
VYRNPKLLKAVASLPCQECGKEGTQAAHANWSWSGKGMGIKAHDMYVAALCPECHYALDQARICRSGRGKNSGCGHGAKQYTSYLRGD